MKMIRQLKRRDLRAAAKVIRAAFATVAAEFAITEQNCPRHTSFITTKKLRKLYKLGWRMFGLYDGGRMVGSVALSDEGGGVFMLHHLAVLPEYRHKGYGKMLLDFCKAAAREQGCEKLTLSLIDESTVLKNWYAANGFTHTGTKKFEHQPFTAGYMQLTVYS